MPRTAMIKVLVRILLDIGNKNESKAYCCKSSSALRQSSDAPPTSDVCRWYKTPLVVIAIPTGPTTVEITIV